MAVEDTRLLIQFVLRATPLAQKRMRQIPAIGAEVEVGDRIWEIRRVVWTPFSETEYDAVIYLGPSKREEEIATFAHDLGMTPPK